MMARHSEQLVLSLAKDSEESLVEQRIPTPRFLALLGMTSENLTRS